MELDLLLHGQLELCDDIDNQVSTSVKGGRLEFHLPLMSSDPTSSCPVLSERIGLCA
jgi:hypothetical protein